MVPQWRHKGGVCTSSEKNGPGKKLIKLLMPSFGFIIRYYPPFIRKSVRPPFHAVVDLGAKKGAARIKNSRSQTNAIGEFFFWLVGHTIPPFHLKIRPPPLLCSGGSRSKKGGLRESKIPEAKLMHLEKKKISC